MTNNDEKFEKLLSKLDEFIRIVSEQEIIEDTIAHPPLREEFDDECEMCGG